VKRLKGYQSLCILNDNLLLYKKNKFYLYNQIDESIHELLGFNQNLVDRIKGSLRLLQRIFRMEIRSAIAIDTERVLFLYKRNLYHLNVNKRTIQELFQINNYFSTPLNLCKALDNPDYIAFFGDYGDNPDRKEVAIYAVLKDLSVEVIHKFSPHTIRHIHNIVPDNKNNGYYIFTGDNDPKSGIYWTDKEFSYMKPIVIGDQRSRTVWGFPTEKGLLYATDSITDKNSIYLLKTNKEKFQLEKITEINGSCIYATETKSGYYFSTTVESEETQNNKIKSMLSKKRGAGILSNDVHLIYITKDLQAKIIRNYKKDNLPYKLFQYGTVRFPSGMETQNNLIFYPFAVKKHDGDTCILDTEN
jgi:hypothetical protein